MRALGVFLVILGLLVLQFSGVMAFTPSGGIDLDDLLKFRWLSNLMSWRMRGGGGMYLGLGVVAIFFIFEGLRRAIRGKKKKEKKAAA